MGDLLGRGAEQYSRVKPAQARAEQGRAISSEEGCLVRRSPGLRVLKLGHSREE